MPPNQTLLVNYATYGDVSQRDLYHRHKNQIAKEEAVENFFYHLDAANTPVNTVLEKVTYDISTNVSKFEIFTKPTTGNLSLAANASMLDITTDKTSVRSILFEANGARFGDMLASGNASVTGTLTVTGNAALGNMSTSGDAAIAGTMSVTGNSSLANVSTSGDAAIAGTMSVTGNSSLANVSTSGDAAIAGTMSVTGNSSLANVTASGNADIAGTMSVTGNTTLSTFLATGNGSVEGEFDVIGNTALSNVVTTGSLAVGSNLSVTGNTSLANVAVVGTLGVTGNTTLVLGEGGVFAVTGNGNVDFGTNNLTSSGNVSFTGTTTIQSLNLIGGISGLTGNLDMSNNNISNVATLSRDNVRIAFDSTTQSISAQTLVDQATDSWDTITTTTPQLFQLSKSLGVTGNSALGGTLSVAGDVVCTGPSVNFGNVTSTTDVTLFGNLVIKGTTTNTRIESNVVQVGDMNIELGFLEVTSLANLSGAGITLGGQLSSFTRPELVYSSTLDAWQPNIDIVTKGLPAAEIATMGVDGRLASRSVANTSVFTMVDSTSINFGDSWRFHLNSVNDTMELQHYESNAWVPKFTYTA